MWLFGLTFTSTGLLIGGAIAWLFKGLKHKIDYIYGICAGIILGLISIEILPEALETGGWPNTIVGFTIGMVIFEILHKLFHNRPQLESTSKKRMHIRTGLLLLISISVHNVPMGIVLGASEKNEFTVSLLETLLFHSIPEGIILFLPLVMAGINVFLGIFITLMVSLPVVLGIFIGDMIGKNHYYISSSMISITIGIILMVTLSEILTPAIMKNSPLKITIFTLVGLGIIALYLKVL